MIGKQDSCGPILVGTSGYSFKDWVGPFYPERTRPDQMLQHYSGCFPCVEINATYYGIPRPAVLKGMADRTPPGFEFTVKANKAMTHECSRDPETYRLFLKCLDPLREAGKFHGVVLQFPWRFRNEARNRAHLAFLRSALPGLPMWVEFRHDSWAIDPVFPFLGGQDLGFIAVDEPDLPGLFPPIARVTGKTAYIRFHGRNASAWWGKSGTDRYDWDYSRAELEVWVEKIRNMSRGVTRTYVFFNNCYMGRAVRSARLMKDLLDTSP